jgi:8-oxo-dGTP diphosphatase
LSRKYPRNPLSAVSGAVFDEQGRILLARRANPPAQGKWSFPGGVVRLGETIEGALKREIQEECGLQIEVGPIVSVSSRIIPDDKGRIQYHYVLLDFLCRSQDDTITVGSDASEAQWVCVDDAGDYELTEGLGSVIRKAVAMKKSTGQDEFH